VEAQPEGGNQFDLNKEVTTLEVTKKNTITTTIFQFCLNNVEHCCTG
jgi:hypothetical protein